jgi:hypothetical protein
VAHDEVLLKKIQRERLSQWPGTDKRISQTEGGLPPGRNQFSLINHLPSIMVGVCHVQAAALRRGTGDPQLPGSAQAMGVE